MLEIQLARDADGRSAHAPGAHRSGSRSTTRSKLRDKGAAFGWWLKALAEDHEAEAIRAEVERLAARDPAAGTSSSTRTRRRCRSSRTSDDALPLMLVMARVIEKEQGDVDRALDMNRQILAIDERNEQALDALERLYLGKGRFEELLEIYEKKLELTARRRRADRDPVEDRPALRGRDQGRQEGDRRVPGDPRRRRRRAERAALARSDLRPQPAVEGAGRHPRPPAHDRRPRRRQGRSTSSSSTGSASSRSSTSATSPGAIDAYRDILDIDVGTPEGARRRSRVQLRGDDKQKLAVAGILEPVYEQLREWAPLVGVHEIQLAAEKDTLRRTSLLLRIGELQRTKLLDAEKAFDAYARAFQRGSVDRGGQGAARGARRR